MTLTELINAVGEQHILVQPLHTSVLRVSAKKHDCEVTFATNQMSPRDLLDLGHTEKIGMILWIPRDRMPAGTVEKKT